MTETLRKPAVFSVDDPRLTVARPEEPQATDGLAAEASEFDPPAIPVPPRRKGIPWGSAVLVGAVRSCADGAGPRGHQPDRGSVCARALARRGGPCARRARGPCAAGHRAARGDRSAAARNGGAAPPPRAGDHRQRQSRRWPRAARRHAGADPAHSTACARPQPPRNASGRHHRRPRSRAASPNAN